MKGKLLFFLLSVSLLIADEESESEFLKESETLWEKRSEVQCETPSETQCETQFESECQLQIETPCEAQYEMPCETQLESECQPQIETPCEAQYEMPCETQFESQCLLQPETPCETPCEVQCETPCESPRCFVPPQVSIGYAVGDYISIGRNYAELDIFVPTLQSNSHFSYVDLRGYAFNGGRWASSAGAGFRRATAKHGIIGVNAYYDYRDTFFRNSFHQVGVGLEWFNCLFDVRANGYVPVSRLRSSKPCIFDELGDGYFATEKKLEYPYSGFDAEIGRWFLRGCNWNFYAGVGPYYFWKDSFTNFWGGLGRLELNWRSIFSVEVRSTYDDIYNWRCQGIFRLTVPFDFFCKSKCQKYCYCPINQRPYRNGLILTNHCCDWTWNWDDTL